MAGQEPAKKLKQSTVCKECGIDGKPVQRTKEGSDMVAFRSFKNHTCSVVV